MNKLSGFLLPLVLAIAWSFVTAFPVAADTGKVNWNTPPKLSLKGLGEVRIGMTLKQVKALFTDVKEIKYDDGDECFYLEPRGVPKGVSFMVTEGHVSRIDITASNYASLSGAKVGQTEKQVIKTYKGKLQVTTHHYDENGHYLTFVPKDRRDKAYRMVFETDGSKVMQFRAGKLPEVEFVEGCL